MRRLALGLWLVTLTFLLTLALYAQDTKPPVAPPTNLTAATTLKPTELQSLRLQVKQKDALLAKAAFDAAQRAFQQALDNLAAEGERVKTENGWPKDTQFQPNDLSFSPAPPPPPVPDVKPKGPPEVPPAKEGKKP